MDALPATYVLPISTPDDGILAELSQYLNALPVCDIVVVDDSEERIFQAFGRFLRAGIRHVRPDAGITGRNGKVRNVLSALRIARFDRIVIADDDVRYAEHSLARVVAALDDAEVVRPQNFFEPLPWHALIDTGRTLINRALDGDWPGTLALRASALPNGYNADVLFENYELVRTVKARGGRELVARGLYVARRPPTTKHFLSQRVRQAYDEFARPARLAAALAFVPLVFGSAFAHLYAIPVAALGAILAVASFGLVRDGGYRVFALAAVFAAPLWVCERGVCAWLAVYQRLRFGGVRYAGGVLRHAATPRKEMRRWAG